MNRDAITEEVRTVLEATFGISRDRLSSQAKIREELDLDSIDVFDLLAAFEKRHSIQLSLHDFKDAVTIDDVVSLLEASFQSPENPAATR